MVRFLALSMTVYLATVPAGQAGPKAVPAADTAVIINNVENMHSRSNDGSDVVSQALLGTNVKVLKKERNADGEDWYQVETPDTYKGWVIGSALRFLRVGEAPYASGGRVFVVTSLFANIYRESDVTKRKPVKTAPISSVLAVREEKNERWCEVVLPCGTPAFIQKGDGELRQAPFAWPRMSAEEMVRLSMKFIGLPYLWGGTSPFGLDCSGFIQLIYKMSGVQILRDADIQFEGSGLREVETGREAAGDLVFFGRSRDKISHVGMMVNGREFINATTHLKPVVQVSSLDDPYWKGLYQGARCPSGS